MVYEEKEMIINILLPHTQTSNISHMAKVDLYARLLKAEALSQSSATQFLEVKSVYIVYFCYLFTHYTLELVFTSSDFQMEKKKVTIAISTAPPVGQT